MDSGCWVRETILKHKMVEQMLLETHFHAFKLQEHKSVSQFIAVDRRFSHLGPMTINMMRVKSAIFNF